MIMEDSKKQDWKSALESVRNLQKTLDDIEKVLKISNAPEGDLFNGLFAGFRRPE